MVGRAVATTVARSRHHRRALPMAMALAAGLIFAAPGNWFVRIESIQVLPTDQGDVVVVSARPRWGAGTLDIAWTARIERLPLDATIGPGVTICSGNGNATIDGDDIGPLRMPLSAWVGDPACRPVQGELHVAHAQWRFRLFGLTKSATGHSAAFAAVADPMRIGLSGALR
jgi:hypothetical protein